MSDGVVSLEPGRELRPSAAGRTRRLLSGVLSSAFSKGVVFLVNAVSIPIMIRYLGAENFGIWMTISTSLSMLLILDLGVANSLTNFISEAYARDDREQASTYSTTALGVMLAVALVLGLVAWSLWPRLDWNQLFHLPSSRQAPEVGRAVAAALLIFLVGLPAGLAAKILGGYQELRALNLFTAVGSVCNLLALVLLVRLRAGLVALVAASSSAIVLANLVCLVWIWSRHKPWLSPRLRHFRRHAARRMMQSGSEFFVLQVSGLIAFSSDNLIVTHYLGPSEVATYSVAWRFSGYATLAQTLIVPALWPAFSEAFVRGDLQWVRRTFGRTLRLTMLTTLAFAAAFALAGRPIIRLWATQAAVPTETLVLLMCVWVLISTFMNNTATVLVAKGETSLMAWTSLVAAAANVALSIYWVQRIGSTGVILGTIVSYLLILIVPQTWKTYSVLRRGAQLEAAGPRC